MVRERAERLLFMGFALAGFTLVLVRAAKVPLVHDEATSFLAYAQTGRFLPFASMWDANNHLLNSAAGHLGYRLFGLEPLSLRWASVLSYGLFAGVVFRLGRSLAHPMVRWSYLLACLGCPFLLDFFSLFRGYGPAMALFLCAMHQAHRFTVMGHARHLRWALSCMALATGFLLALVPVWALLLGVLLMGCRTRAALVQWGVLGGLPLLLAGALALQYARLGLLYHGSTEGFIPVSVGSLALRVIGMDGTLPRAALLAPAAAAIGLLLWHAWWRRSSASPGFLAAVLLLGEALLRILLAEAFGINHAEDRAALHLLLAALLAVAAAADLFAARIAWGGLAAMPLLALPICTVSRANLTHTVLWPEQSLPHRFAERVERLERVLSRPAVVGMHRLAGLPWSLERRMRGGEGDGTAQDWPLGLNDARVVQHAQLAAAGNGYAVADSAPDQGLWLLMRQPAMRTEPVHDTLFSWEAAGQERSPSLGLPIGPIRSGGALVDISASMRTGVNPAELRLGIAVRDDEGAIIHGDLVFLSTRRAVWAGESWRSVRPVPRLPRAVSAEVFLWSPAGEAYRLDEGRLRLLKVH